MCIYHTYGDILCRVSTTQINAYVYAYTHTHMYTHIHVYISDCDILLPNAYMMCAYTHTHVYTHICVYHMYIHIYVYISDGDILCQTHTRCVHTHTHMYIHICAYITCIYIHVCTYYTVIFFAEWNMKRHDPYCRQAPPRDTWRHTGVTHTYTYICVYIRW